MSILGKQTVQTAGGLTLKGIFKFLKFGSLFIIFGIVFAKAAIDSYSQKSFVPIIREIGGKLTLATKELADQSTAIIESGNIYVNSLWNIITTYAELIFAVLAIYAWIKLFAWLWARTPYSWPGNSFENTTIGVIVFAVFQVLFIVVVKAFAGEIHDWNDAGRAIAIPFIAFFLLFKAIVILINPVSKQIENLAS